MILTTYFEIIYTMLLCILQIFILIHMYFDNNNDNIMKNNENVMKNNLHF